MSKTTPPLPPPPQISLYVMMAGLGESAESQNKGCCRDSPSLRRHPLQGRAAGAGSNRDGEGGKSRI